MRTRLNTALAVTAAALLGGCASGGGGGDTTRGEPVPITYTKPLACLIVYCPLTPEEERQRYEDRLKELGLMPSSTPSFTRWSELPPLLTPYFSSVEYQYDILSGSLSYGQDLQGSISTSRINSAATEYRGSGPDYDGNRALHSTYSIAKWDPDARFATLAPIGQPGIDVAFEVSSAVGAKGPSPFSSSGAYNIELVANPYAIGWDYQSFGAWNDHRDGASRIVLKSYGAATPATAVPTAGSATFTGKLGGFYISPSGQGSMAAADLAVNADFSARSLSFASTGTVTTRDLATPTVSPNLNLSGTLTYSPASNTFAGTLTNAGATMSGSSTGRYYGPAAQELGGVFTLKSPTTVETFTGAYGAKR